jgi:hypothetical protein
MVGSDVVVEVNVGEVVSEDDLSVWVDFDELGNSEAPNSSGCDLESADSTKEAECSKLHISSPLSGYSFFFLVIIRFWILDFGFWIEES